MYLSFIMIKVVCCLDLPVTNAFSSCPLSPEAQGLTLTTFILHAKNECM